MAFKITMEKIKKISTMIDLRYLEPYRGCSNLNKKIDRAMISIGLISSLSTIVQIIHIATTQNVGGISLISWFGYFFVALCWFLYGFFHKSTPLVFVNVVAMLTNLVVIFQYFIFV